MSKTKFLKQTKYVLTQTKFVRQTTQFSLLSIGSYQQSETPKIFKSVTALVLTSAQPRNYRS